MNETQNETQNKTHQNDNQHKSNLNISIIRHNTGKSQNPQYNCQNDDNNSNNDQYKPRIRRNSFEIANKIDFKVDDNNYNDYNDNNYNFNDNINSEYTYNYGSPTYSTQNSIPTPQTTQTNKLQNDSESPTLQSSSFKSTNILIVRKRSSSITNSPSNSKNDTTTTEYNEKNNNEKNNDEKNSDHNNNNDHNNDIFPRKQSSRHVRSQSANVNINFRNPLIIRRGSKDQSVLSTKSVSFKNTNYEFNILNKFKISNDCSKYNKYSKYNTNNDNNDNNKKKSQLHSRSRSQHIKYQPSNLISHNNTPIIRRMSNTPSIKDNDSSNLQNTTHKIRSIPLLSQDIEIEIDETQQYLSSISAINRKNSIESNESIQSVTSSIGVYKDKSQTYTVEAYCEPTFIMSQFESEYENNNNQENETDNKNENENENKSIYFRQNEHDPSFLSRTNSDQPRENIDTTEPLDGKEKVKKINLQKIEYDTMIEDKHGIMRLGQSGDEILPDGITAFNTPGVSRSTSGRTSHLSSDDYNENAIDLYENQEDTKYDDDSDEKEKEKENESSDDNNNDSKSTMNKPKSSDDENQNENNDNNVDKFKTSISMIIYESDHVLLTQPNSTVYKSTDANWLQDIKFESLCLTFGGNERLNSLKEHFLHVLTSNQNRKPNDLVSNTNNTDKTKENKNENKNENENEKSDKDQVRLFLLSEKRGDVTFTICERMGLNQYFMTRKMNGNLVSHIIGKNHPLMIKSNSRPHLILFRLLQAQNRSHENALFISHNKKTIDHFKQINACNTYYVQTKGMTEKDFDTIKRKFTF